MKSTLLRTKIALDTFAADANPNTTPPSSADVAALPSFVFNASGNGGTRKLLITPVFTEADADEVPTATVTGVIWLQDESDNKWIKVGVLTALVHRESVLISSLSQGKLFIQVTAVSAVTAVAVAIRAIPVAEAS